jgi:hypothetical protein
VSQVLVKKNLWPAIVANLRLAQKSYAAIGFPGDAPKSNAAHGGTGMTNLQVAIINEFGSAPAGAKPSIPARPFIKETIRRDGYRGPLYMLGKNLLALITRGEMSTKIALDRWGKAGADATKATIVASKEWAVPNAPYTKAKKRSSTPLIDTGAMRQAITHKTRMKRS